MTREFGIMPGGGILNAYHFDPEEFGVVGANAFKHLVGETKVIRKTAFHTCKAMLRAFNLIKADEVVMNMCLGTDRLGNVKLVVVTTVPGGPM